MAKRILVIDDSPTIRKQLKTILEMHGYEVAEAVDGLDALSLVKKDARIGLILCDINMPRLSGMQFLEAIYPIERLRSIPVVMVTTESNPTFIQEAKKLGVRGWLLKPVKAEALLAVATKLAK